MNRRKFRGFTLVEVLVVIAIIGILASLLLPVLARAKAKANRVKCVNNLSQIGKAFRGFADSNDDRLPWQLTPDELKYHFGNENPKCTQAIFSLQAIKVEVGGAKLLASPCDGQVAPPNEMAEENWSTYDTKKGKMIPCEAISYYLIEGADMARPWTMLAATRNLSTGDLATAKWVGANEESPKGIVISGLNNSQGQAVFTDGSASQTNDSDIGAEGGVTKAHRRDHQSSSGGVSIGPASTLVIGCCGGGGVDVPGCGLKATYYKGANWDGESTQRIDGTLYLPFGQADRNGRGFSCPILPYDIPLSSGPLGGPFPDCAYPLRSTKWKGQIRANSSEEYTFYMSVDNEGWIYINGTEVLHRAAAGGAPCWQFVRSNPVSLRAGEWVDIEVRHKEWHWIRSPQYSFIRIEWESPSTKRGKIHCRNLRPPP